MAIACILLRRFPRRLTHQGIQRLYEKAEYPTIILIIEYSLDRHFKNDIYYSSIQVPITTLAGD